MRLSEIALKWTYRGVVPILAGVCCFVAASIAVQPPSPLNALEVGGLESQFSLGKYPPANPNIVLVVIKPDTPRALSVPAGMDKVPRHFHAQLLQGLDEAGARCALLDIAFTTPVPAEDPSLISTLRNLRSLRVTLATLHEPDPPPVATPVGFSGVFTPSVVWPFRTTEHVAIGSGDDIVTHDTGLFLGGYVEQFDPGRSLRLYHASITTALQYAGELNAKPIHDLRHDRFTIGSFDWKLNPNQALLCQWLKEPDPFRTYEYADALRLLHDPKTRTQFKDKIVVIGDIRGVDSAATAPFGDIPGPYFMAQLLNTALLPYSARTESFNEIAFAIWCSALGTLAFSTALSRRNLLFVGVTALSLVACFLAPRLTVPLLGESIPTWIPAITTGLAAVSGLIAGRTQLARRDFRSTGLQEEATVMFVDLKGSTEMVQSVGAVRFHELIADFQDRCAKIVRRNGGVVERTLGDGFLAVYRGSKGAHHALRALNSIEALQEAGTEIGAIHDSQVLITIGIESGIVSGGYVVESEGKVWTSSGAAVNLAHRLQGSCSELGIPVAIGPAARGLTVLSVPSHVIAKVELKGFVEPVEVATLGP